MPGVIVDTHALVWYLDADRRLSNRALATLTASVEQNQAIYLSAITIVEVAYLVEKARLPEQARHRLDRAVADGAFGLVVVPLDLAIAQELRHVSRDAVPDMPDRVIAATARHLGLPLITRDAAIQQAAPYSVAYAGPW